MELKLCYDDKAQILTTVSKQNQCDANWSPTTKNGDKIEFITLVGRTILMIEWRRWAALGSEFFPEDRY